MTCVFLLSCHLDFFQDIRQCFFQRQDSVISEIEEYMHLWDMGEDAIIFAGKDIVLKELAEG